MNTTRNAREVRQAARALREYKAEVETQIAKLLREFVDETGIGISGLEFSAYDKTLPNGSTISMPVNVHASLEFKN